MSKSSLALAGLTAIALSACASPQTYQGPLSGTFEVPPTNSRGAGSVIATVYPTTRAMTYVVEYKDLSGPVTAAHIHGPAAPGTNAPVVIPAKVTPTPIKGGATLTPAQLADLQAGKYYFNLHSDMFPNGEVRGLMLRAQ